MAGMAGMAEWQKEWQNGRMAEMDTYVLFTVHAATDTDDDDDNDTLIFYSIEDESVIHSEVVSGSTMSQQYGLYQVGTGVWGPSVQMY